MTPAAHPDRQPGEAGFTMVEVLVSVAVFALSFMGVMAMMLTSVGANSSSRDMTSATHLGDLFAERFVVSARNWTNPALTAAQFPELSIAQNTWKEIGTAFVDSEGRTAAALNANLSGRAMFCVNYQWVLNESVVSPPSAEAQITVRVAWGRGGYGVASCAAATVTAELAASNMRAILLPIVVRTDPR